MLSYMERKDDENVGSVQTARRCYTVDDLREILQCGRAAVYDLLKTNQFRVIKLGGVGYRIPKASFDAWFESGKSN